MKIFQALKSGFFRATGSWKGILVTWLVSLILAAMISIPLKAVLSTGFGSSMITERFLHGMNIETFTDLGLLFQGLMRSLSSGIIILILISFISNAFLTGGLFVSVNNSPENRNFWQACARNFWTFLLVQVFICILISFVLITITVVPALVVSFGEVHSERTIFLVVLVSLIVFFLILPVFVIVADCTRAFLVKGAKSGFFSAIGYGFRQTFRNLAASWLLMLILIIIQLLYLVLCFFVLSGLIPSTGGGVFMLLLLSQFLFIIRIFLRVFRYGSVTSLMEQSQNLPLRHEGTKTP